MKQHEFHTDIKHQYTVRLLGTRSLSIRVVYSHIANYTAAKGCWCGDMKDLARQIEIPYTTVCDQMKELIKRGLVVKDGDRYSTNVVPENTTVVSKNTNVVSPHTPLYIESQKEINNRLAYQKDRRRRLEVDVDSLALFTQYYQMFPHKAKNNAIKQQAQNEFVALSRDTQQAILTQLQKRLTAGIPLPDTSPLMYIRHFDPDAPPDKPPQIEQPTNYNHGTPPPDAKPALYNGEWGMYTPEDIDKFDLLTKEKMKQPLNQEQ